MHAQRSSLRNSIGRDSSIGGTGVALRTDNRAIDVRTEIILNIPELARGKVRHMFVPKGSTDQLLLAASDRISAFDVVMPEGVPHKGRVLTEISAYWFGKTRHIVPNHMIHMGIEGEEDFLNGRVMTVMRLNPYPVEAVVRGFLTGSVLEEYKANGTVWGEKLPEGLKDGSRLERPIFTPTTKAAVGHDEPITFEQMVELIGDRKAAEAIRDLSLELYKFGRDDLLPKGLILADTKLEFGHDKDGKLYLIDEAMTPDSSRYWVKKDYDEGRLVNVDKEPLRQYLKSIGWNRKPPAPHLPPEVIEATSQRYLRALEMVTGE
jgi:phosphoribosylaminoimidazole-succinocarboxamide synthase